MSTFNRVRPLLMGLIGVLCAILVLGIVYTIFQIRETQTQNTGIVERLDSVANQINDCVNPEGECAKQGAQRTADAVELIALQSAYNLVCSVTEDENTEEQTAQELLAKIQKCANELKAEAKQ